MMTATEIEVMYFETKGRCHKPRLKQLPKAEEGKETILAFQSLGGTDLPLYLVLSSGKIHV